jgi:hypothetical protein
MIKSIHLLLIACLLTAASSISFAQTENEINERRTSFVATESPQTVKLNRNEVAEAFPFLSADGLRLYFTTDREGGFGRLYLATRASVDVAFEKAEPLSRKIPDGFYSATLTADELTIYMSNDGTVYVAHRKNMASEFEAPQKLDINMGGWAFAPAISPDGRELIVTVSIKEQIGEANLLFRKDKSGVFQLVTKMYVPDKFIAGAGQFSKDGRSFYSTIKLEGDSESIFRYVRNSVDEEFGEPTPLPQNLQKYHSSGQPSVNGDETILAYVVSDGVWHQDDIVVVNTTPSNTEKKKSQPIVETIRYEQLKIYPNPFQNKLIIDFNVQPESGTVLYLYDVSGKLILQQKINGKQTSLNFTSPPGIYMFRVSSNERIISAGKLVHN